jgi:membrane protein
MVHQLILLIKNAKMKKKLKRIAELIKRAAIKYKKDDPMRLVGTTAYVTIFAMAPIIIIIVSIVGILMGQEQIQNNVSGELNQLIGEQGTHYIENLVSNYQDQTNSVIGTIVGFAIFIFTSTTFFAVLQESLNYVWRTKAKPLNNLLKAFYNQLLSFGLVLSVGSVMLVSLLWVFYASLIFFFGVEITQQYAEMYSHRIVPKSYTVEFDINEIKTK